MRLCCKSDKSRLILSFGYDFGVTKEHAQQDRRESAGTEEHPDLMSA